MSIPFLVISVCQTNTSGRECVAASDLDRLRIGLPPASPKGYVLQSIVTWGTASLVVVRQRKACWTVTGIALWVQISWGQ